MEDISKRHQPHRDENVSTAKVYIENKPNEVEMFNTAFRFDLVESRNEEMRLDWFSVRNLEFYMHTLALHANMHKKLNACEEKLSHLGIFTC